MIADNGKLDICILGDQDEQEYASFVANSPDATIYHSLMWRQVIAESYRFKPMYLIARDNGDIVGALPLFRAKTLLRGLRLISLPFSHEVKILARDDAVRTAMLAYLAEKADELHCKRVEIRDGATGRCSQLFQNAVTNHGTELQLTQPLDDLWKSFHVNIRNGVRKAEKNDVHVARGAEWADYLAFYELLARTRKRLGAPLYPKRFFRALWEHCAAGGHSRIYLAHSENTITAGVLVLRFNRNAVYGYNASTPDRRLLGLCPNYLLLWQAIKDSFDDGDTTFDFGSTPLFHKGLLHFKKQWTNASTELEYGFLGEHGSHGINREGKAVRTIQAVMKRTPIWLLKRLGPLMLRESV